MKLGRHPGDKNPVLVAVDGRRVFQFPDRQDEFNLCSQHITFRLQVVNVSDSVLDLKIKDFLFFAGPK